MTRPIFLLLCFAKALLLCCALQSLLSPSSQRHRSRRTFSQASPLLASSSSSSSFSSSSKLLSNDEIRRYSRHLVLSDVGVKGQEALKKASVLVIGAGGLGSPALLYLAAAGVGHIGIVDGDTVDESNLQRQIIHSVQTVGATKCDSAKRAIHGINPHVQVRTFIEEFTAQTAERIVRGGFYDPNPCGDGDSDDDDIDIDNRQRRRSWDVIIDGSDNFPTKYLINDVCAMHGIPWIYSAILAFEGQLSVFNLNKDAPDYRDLLPVPPLPGNVPSCAEGGVLGVLPGTMGCLQATEAIKLILGRTEGLLSGRVLRFDAMSMTFSETKLSRAPHRTAITELIDYKGFCGGPKTPPSPPTPAAAVSNTSTKGGGRTMDEVEAGSSDVAGRTFHELTPSQCVEKLTDGWAPWVLDVRLQAENDIVRLPFTDRVKPHRSVTVTDVPKTGDVLVYCKAGVRGKKACTTLVEMGVEPSRLYNLQGGILQWQQEIDPSMPRY